MSYRPCFYENILAEEQAEALEESLWTSLRLIEERRNLLLSLADHAEEVGETDSVAANRSIAEELARHAQQMKSLLQTISRNDLIK